MGTHREFEDRLARLSDTMAESGTGIGTFAATWRQHPEHLHGSGHPDLSDPDCCMCGTEDGEGCIYVGAALRDEHRAWDADRRAYLATLPPDEGEPPF